VFGLAVLALVLVAALVEQLGVVASPAEIPKAALELFTLLRAGEHTDFQGRLAFTRVRASDGQAPQLVDDRGPVRAPLLTRGGDSLTVELPTVVYNCQQVERGTSCGQPRQTASVPASEATGVMIALGKYDATALRTRRLRASRRGASECGPERLGTNNPASSRDGPVPGADGILLRSGVVGAISIDERGRSTSSSKRDDAAARLDVRGLRHVGAQVLSRNLGAVFDDAGQPHARASIRAGAALFVANALALYRRRTDSRAAMERTCRAPPGGEPGAGYKRTGESTDLPQAPLARTGDIPRDRLRSDDCRPRGDAEPIAGCSCRRGCAPAGSRRHRSARAPSNGRIPSRPGNVRRRVQACGVCRTDLHLAEGDLHRAGPT